MESRPSASVVMPVYNCERYVGQALESLLAQTYADFELIAIDDGSSDDSVAAIQTFTDARIRLIQRQENGGIVAALNDGLAAARGEFIVRQDADDTSHPERLAKQISYLQQHPAVGVVGTWYAKMDEDGQELVQRTYPTEPSELAEKIFSGSYLCHASTVMRKALLETVGGYRQVVGPTEDYDLWLRLAEVTQFANLPEVLYYVRINPASIMSSTSLEVAHACLDLIRRIAAQRRATGVDPLAAKDEDILTEVDRLRTALANAPIPSPRFRRARHNLMLSEDALKLGDLALAWRYCKQALLALPFWGPPWRLAAGIVRRRLTGGRAANAKA